MELLVCNKIISLDLNVNDVYQRLWLLSQPTSAHVMRIVYRMRGLLGEATEDMVDTFAKGEEEINDEEKFQVLLPSCPIYSLFYSPLITAL